MSDRFQDRSLTARWVRDSRYYEACVAVDLFGQNCVIVTHGRIETRLGRRFTIPVESGAAALCSGCHSPCYARLFVTRRKL